MLIFVNFFNNNISNSLNGIGLYGMEKLSESFYRMKKVKYLYLDF